MRDLDDSDTHEIASAGLRASIKSDGAELCSLQDGTGRDYLWAAGPAWPRHAPVLFPIVGRLRDDMLVHQKREYRMTQHGFARDRRFAWIARSATGCLLALSDDDQTRAMYPFGFRLEIGYQVADASLAVTLTVINTGDEVLPASMGAHPAFRWPLAPKVPKTAYGLTFEADETAPMRGVAGGLLAPTDHPSPIVGRHLGLADDLFLGDALILPHPASRSVRFAADGSGPALTISWDGFEQLGLWSRVGSDFLCIEPWHGMASPADFTGDFMDKPWLMLIAPGDRRTATYTVRLEPGDSGT